MRASQSPLSRLSMVALLQVFVHAIDGPAGQFRLLAWLSRLLPGSGAGATQTHDLLSIGRVASDGQRAANGAAALSPVLILVQMRYLVGTAITAASSANFAIRLIRYSSLFPATKSRKLRPAARSNPRLFMARQAFAMSSQNSS